MIFVVKAFLRWYWRSTSFKALKRLYLTQFCPTVFPCRVLLGLQTIVRLQKRTVWAMLDFNGCQTCRSVFKYSKLLNFPSAYILMESLTKKKKNLKPSPCKLHFAATLLTTKTSLVCCCRTYLSIQSFYQRL